MNQLTSIPLEFKKSMHVLRALNHPLRYRMLDLIRFNKNSINVTDIYIALRLDQPVASQHLSILRNAGVVSTKKNGKEIYYSVNDKAIQNLQVLACGIADHKK